MKWSVVLAVVAGAVAVPYLYRRFHEELRRRVETPLAQHYPGLKVSIRSAELVQGKGIRVRGISIVEPGAEGPQAEMLYVEEALFECPTDWKNFVQGDLPVRRVTVRRPTLRATRRPDGSWSTAKLLPPPQLSDRPPTVTIENGVIEILDPLKTPASTLTLRDVNLSLTPASMTDPGATPHMRRLQGMLAGDGLRRVEFEGVADLHTPTCSLRGQAEGVEVSPEMRDSLPDPLAKLLAVGDLRGQGELRFELRYDPAAAAPLQYDISGRLIRGRIDDARLPHALTDIRATVHIDNGGCTVKDLTAQSGQGTLRMACQRSGLEANSPFWLTAEVRRLDLDRALLGILPDWAQDQWHKYLPAGEVDADVRLSFDGRLWQREVAMRCLNVSFTHHKFPYRLEHGKGTLDLKDDRLLVRLTAYSGSQPVRLEATVEHPFSEDPAGCFWAKGDDIQLNESLLAALPEKPREVIRSLDPRGMVNFYLRIWRDKPDGPMHQHLQLAPHHCSIRYSKFPYPISDIRGTLEMIDDNWTFRGLEGSNDKARITCKGSLTPGLVGNELVLNLAGRDVPLSEDLRDALSPHIQQVWHDVRPRGTVDLTAEVRYLSEQKKFNIGVRIQPQRESTSIEPVRFPYRLDHLEGVVTYQDGDVAFERCRGEHGAVRVLADGSCHFQSDGRWNIHFANLSVDRLRTDRELIQALPERLRKVAVELAPSGTVNLNGSLDLARTGPPNEPLQARWDVRLGLQQSNLQLGGVRVENIHGHVSLRGEFDGQYVRSRGELALDSLSYKDCQFIQVMGPIWIDDSRVLFGSWVDRRENGTTVATIGPAQPPRPITANLFSGKFYADGWVALGPEPRYAVNATLTDADLANCARQLGAGRQNLRGKILATADLTGSGRTRNTLSGKGIVRLSDGDVYQLPVMVSLLKLLSIRPPDQNAFSTANIEYQIEGEHIYLNQIDFNGDAISLHGKGEMNFQSAISLTFHAQVGRGELDLPLVKQVFSGASQQIMLIHVSGALQNPETRREALPAVNQALQQLRDELQNRR